MHTDSAPGGDSTARDGTSASPDRAEVSFGFTIESRLDPGSRTRSPYSLGQGSVHGRAGVIRTPHGDIQTPAFIPVGTKATVKAVRPEEMRELGAQALLANAYHLYLQPGADLVDEAGGLAAFMNWHGPTFTDSGGFQVMSLGSGFKKVISMEAAADKAGLDDDATAAGKARLSFVDDDGVNFKSHLDGSLHRFTPEISMRVQHQLGADIMFAFDELTTLMNSRAYQEESLERTRLWAIRCIEEHKKLTAERSTPGFAGLPNGKPYQRFSASSREHSTKTCGAKPAATWAPWTSTATESAGRWKRKTSARSSAGAMTNCPKTVPGTCWGSPNRTTCSPRCGQVLTRSTACSRRA